MNKSKVILGLIIAAMLSVFFVAAVAPASNADTVVVLSPTQDTQVNSSAPTTTYGGAATFHAQNSASVVIRSYLKFDLSSIPSGSTITSETLTVTPTTSLAQEIDANATSNTLNDNVTSWTQANLNWNTSPAVGLQLSSVASLTANTAVNFNVGTSINTEQSFALTTPGTVKAEFNSKEATSSTVRPVLTVTYTSGGGGGSANYATPCINASVPTGNYDHVIWIWEENKKYSDIVGSSSAPYMNSLISDCGLPTNYHGVTHPSMPNYLAATSGSTYGITDDKAPSAHPISADSIFNQGITVGGYQESMPTNCKLTGVGNYVVRHNPETYYTQVRTPCATDNVPMGVNASGSGNNFYTAITSGTLPQFSFVTPDLNNDMHNGSIATADAWLDGWMQTILNSTMYGEGKTAIFIVWDEDNPTTSNNLIPGIVVAPSVPAGTTSGTNYNHYSLLRTTEEMLGITTYLGNASTATSMRAGFHL